jgi:hypothetical protein
MGVMREGKEGRGGEGAGGTVRVSPYRSLGRGNTRRAKQFS